MAGTTKSSDARAIWIALGGYAVLFAGKLVTYFATHLGVMFAEAMHSMADMLIATFLLIAAYLSAKPADEDFRFGYGRAQNIAALVAATIFISFTSFETLRESVPKLFHPAETSPEGFGLASGVIVVSMLISAIPIVTIMRQRERGAAVKAQLIEGVNDEVALVAALLGIILVSQGFGLADPIASIIVALIIAFNAVILWRENATLLMGVSPDKAFYERIDLLAHSVPGVLGTHGVIAEQVGAQIHLGMHVEVQSGITIEEADLIGDTVHDTISGAFDDIYVVVHVDPVLDSAPATA